VHVHEDKHVQVDEDVHGHKNVDDDDYENVDEHERPASRATSNAVPSSFSSWRS
jgi:hypothetical protein